MLHDEVSIVIKDYVVIDKNQILKLLGAVKLDGSAKDIVSDGAIQDVVIEETPKGTKVIVVVQLDAQQASMAETIHRSIESTLRQNSKIAEISVILSAHRNAKPERQPHAHQKIFLPYVKYIVAVASGKGGVGKSTTSVNLAIALQQMGLKVGLLDADIYGPSIPRMLGISGKPQITDDKKMIPHERYGLKTMSMGFLIAEDMPMVWRGPMVHAAITQLFRDVAWGELDIMIVDLPPGTGDAQLTMAQSVPLSGVIIVSTPQDIALIDARKAIAMFQKVEVPVLGMIENMSQFICPHCGGRSDIFSHGGAREEASRLGMPFLGEIPLTLSIREHADSGEPIATKHKDGEASKHYAEAAKIMWKRLSQVD